MTECWENLGIFNQRYDFDVALTWRVVHTSGRNFRIKFSSPTFFCQIQARQQTQQQAPTYLAKSTTRIQRPQDY